MRNLNCRLPLHWRTLCTHKKQPSQAPTLWRKPVGIDTGALIYNCTAKRNVPLILQNDKFVSWYTCGPTVYAATHLGHASCYVKLDILQRILREHFHLNLVTAMNITDIDDKIIRSSIESGRNWYDIAKCHETEFWSDLNKLNVLEPNIKIRVTEHIPSIVNFIEKIVKAGFAYLGKDNSIYFNVKTYPNYGKLQRIDLNEVADVDVPKIESKRDAADFALWKAQKNASEPSWPSPWGFGRPGWHIECSVLASMIFGQSLDFHAGGLDLRFPHHENEEAQSCVYHNCTQWVNYWLHTGQLHIRGQAAKMSKSLGNTVSVNEMLTKYSADDFRMSCVLSNYRSTMDYSVEMMETAKNTLQKFKTFNADCHAFLTGKKKGANLDVSLILKHLNLSQLQVDACFKDDFNTARAVSVLLEQSSSISRCINAPETLSSTHNTDSSCLDTIAAVNNFVQQTLRTLGFAFVEQHCAKQGSSAIKQAVDVHALLDDILQSRQVIRERAVATKNKELFRVCDEIRQCLGQHGIKVRDHGHGSTWNFSGNES